MFANRLSQNLLNIKASLDNIIVYQRVRAINEKAFVSYSDSSVIISPAQSTRPTKKTNPTNQLRNFTFAYYHINSIPRLVYTSVTPNIWPKLIVVINHIN